MQRLQILLFDCLLRNEPHLGSTDRLKNRSRVPGVVLLISAGDGWTSAVMFMCRNPLAG